MAKTELEELVEFLHHEQDPIRTVALQHLVGFSQGPHTAVFAHDNYRPITDLMVLSMSVGRTTANQAFTILVNLCADEHIRGLIAKDDEYLKFLVHSVIDLENKNADLGCILLTNVAKHDNAKKILSFSVNTPHKDVFKSTNALDCLIDAFVKGVDNQLNKSASFDYLAYFFADISRFIEGRKYFVTKQQYDDVVPINKLLVFTEKYDNKTRREGIASTIKNSLFELEKHTELLEVEGVNILPYLLLPIATSQDAELDEEELFDLPDELQLLPEDKLRDPLPEIICVHLESLLLLCSTRATREYLRSKSVYPLIRELHKNVDNDDIQELCDRLVQMLMRDEDHTLVEEIISKEQVGDIGDEEPDMIEDKETDESDDEDIVEVV